MSRNGKGEAVGGKFICTVYFLNGCKWLSEVDVHRQGEAAAGGSGQ